jgi:hypothetical protein
MKAPSRLSPSSFRDHQPLGLLRIKPVETQAFS